MNFEKVSAICAKYNIYVDPMDVPILVEIARLPTSDIAKLFNDLAIEDVFSTEERLF